VSIAKASKLRSRLRALKSERRRLAAAAFGVSTGKGVTAGKGMTAAKASKMRSRLRALQSQVASA
jgi:hypothetical protein